MMQLGHGRLEIPILSEIAEFQFEASQDITLPLVTIIITQGNTLSNKTEVNEITRKITNEQEHAFLNKPQNWNKIKLLIP